KKGNPFREFCCFASPPATSTPPTRRICIILIILRLAPTFREVTWVRNSRAGLGVITMSEFVYCLNTSTIRPTPLLEKIAIAGKAGYQAIEPWNDEITAYLDEGGSVDGLKGALA